MEDRQSAWHRHLPYFSEGAVELKGRRMSKALGLSQVLGNGEEEREQMEEESGWSAGSAGKVPVVQAPGPASRSPDRPQSGDTGWQRQVSSQPP